MKSLVKKVIPGFLLQEYRNYRKQQQIKPYKGDKVYCPVCKSNFAMFLPFGSPKRENAQCLVCGSLERHRLLYLYLGKKTNIFDNETKIRLLHFGPEKCFYDLFSQKQNIEYIPCDLFPEHYNYKGKTKIQKVDITNIEFEENYFDVILCNHVLEHIPDDKQAMSELRRVMKKSGWGIFQVPIDYNRKKTYEDFNITEPKEREKAFGQDDHVRWYGQDYKDRLKAAGFTVTEDDFIRQFSLEELFRFGLMSSELIYHCKKSIAG